VGFEEDIGICFEGFDGAEAGGGRPESCGVGVAADIVVVGRQMRRTSCMRRY
jgi:hypothetical protein